MTAGAVVVPTIIPLRPPIPGKPKAAIDSNTKIELESGTRDATVYYTINGSKPEPFLKIGGIEKCTMQYRGPFTLPAGKQTVKAVAVASDGMRESNVVTKVFDVQYSPSPDLPPMDDDTEFQDEMEQEKAKLSVKRATKNFLLSTKSAWTDVSRENTQRMSDINVSGSDYRRPTTGPRFLNTRRGVSPPRGVDSRLDTSNSYDMSRSPGRHTERRLPDSTTQTLRLQRQTDFLKCIYCFSDRPSDPYARFCHTCGNPVPPIPQTRMAPPEPGQMGMCVYCKSLVPFNTTSCLVCEGPIPQQNQPQASVKLLEKTVCTLCGTANPSNMNCCVTCDTRLPKGPQVSLFTGQAAPPLPSADKKWLKCTKCGRVNSGEARFCDWCGAKPAQPASTMTCSKCGANNHPYAGFCGSCGVKIDAPLRMDQYTNGTGVVSSQWLPVSSPLGMAPKPTMTVSTQTTGIYFPSQTKIVKTQEQQEEKQAFEKQMRDRRPLLTAVSPGRGYWRKQVEHICQHLKAHAQNSAEFRALIGEPKMGKLLTSTVQEDGYELSLSMTFALRGGKDQFSGKRLGITGEYLSMHTELDSDYSGSDEEILQTPKKKGSPKKIKHPKKKPLVKVAPLDQKLFRELGVNGDGDPAEIQHLIDEGADANALNKDELPVLHVAVKHKRTDCLEVLVDSGSEVNKEGPSSIKKNTALHEAVNLGPSGVHIIDKLIGLGADQNRKNARGETPYDLAVKAGYENIVNKFASALGQSMLNNMARPKGSS